MPDDDKTILSVHYYSPSDFAIAERGTEWGIDDDEHILLNTPVDNLLHSREPRLAYYVIGSGVRVLAPGNGNAYRIKALRLYIRNQLALRSKNFNH